MQMERASVVLVVAVGWLKRKPQTLFKVESRDDGTARHSVRCWGLIDGSEGVVVIVAGSRRQ